MKLVSIIITIYKKKDTIRKCLESVINQTYPNIEVVLINDDYEETLPYYEDMLSAIKEKGYKLVYYTNEVNVGAGLGRRKGVELSTGDYTNFLDADDYIKPDYIEQLAKAAEENDAELVTSGFIHVENSKETERIDTFGVYEGESKFRVGLKDSLRFLNTCLVSSKLWETVEYSKERFIEDSPVLFKLIYICNKRVVIPYAGYYYIQNGDSLCHTSSRVKYLIYTALCSADVVKFLKEKGDKAKANSVLDTYIARHRELQSIKISEEETKLYREQLAALYVFFLENFKI